MANKETVVTMYSEAEILNATGIVLEKPNSMVKHSYMQYAAVEKVAPKKYNLVGVNGEKTPINERSMKYLHEKTHKGVHAVSRKQLEELYAASTPFTLKFAFPFFVNVIAEKSTGIGFALTWAKLVPLNAKIFNAYLEGVQAKIPAEVPFELGQTIIYAKPAVKAGQKPELKAYATIQEGKQPSFMVQFGRYNGNSGITVQNAKGATIKNVNGKHLGNSISVMCATLRNLAVSEKFAMAETTEEAKTILEGFKGTGM